MFLIYETKIRTRLNEYLSTLLTCISRSRGGIRMYQLFDHENLVVRDASGDFLLRLLFHRQIQKLQILKVSVHRSASSQLQFPGRYALMNNSHTHSIFAILLRTLKFYLKNYISLS